MICKNLSVRAADTEDVDLLWEFLAVAAYEPNGQAARQQPVVAAHLQNWPGAHDFGYIALRDGKLAGAAWVRQFSLNEQPSIYFNAQTPELSIGVAEDARGNGVGSRLLTTILAEAGRRQFDVCLTVRHTNPALRLYLRHGFERVPHLDVPNRTGGISYAMLWQCKS